MSGDTRVYGFRDSETQTHFWAMKQLYEMQSTPRGLATLRQIRFRSVDADGRIVRGRVKKVLASGTKTVFRVKTKSWREIKATACHRFLTPDGWRRLRQISVGQRLVANGLPAWANKEEGSITVFSDEVVSIEKLPPEETYDIIMESEPHNFVANGLVVHNSQESSRFCEHHGYYVIPPAYEEADAHRLTIFRAACQSNWNTYQDELEVMFHNYETEHKMEPKGAAKKRIFEAAAGLLNQYTETSFVWTTNPIALRKFLKERCNPAADAEIDRFARSLARLCFMTWPNLFMGDDLDGVRLRCGVKL